MEPERLHENDLLTFLPLIEDLRLEDREILHFEGDKIKEAWTMGNMADLVQ